MTTKTTLPAGWRWVKLGEHTTKIGSGITPLGGHATYLSSGIPLIRSQNVLMNDFSYEGLVYISPEQDSQMEKSRVLPGDVLLNITGASIGRVSVAPSEICPANVNQHVNIIRCDHTIWPKFLSFFISNPDFQKTIFDKQAGATRQALTKEQVENFEIPLPPLAEQQRIAAQLNEQMAAIAQARQAAEEQLRAARALPSVYLRDVVKNHVWKSVNLSFLCTIVRGSSPRPKGDPRYYGSDVPRLMVEDVTRDGMYVTPKVDFLTIEGSKLSRPMKKGDVVMVVSGAPGLPGILAVDACIHDGFVGFRDLQTDKILQEFLYFALQYYRSENDKEATGAIFRNLTTDQVGKFKIPIPEIAVQKEIILQLEDKLESSKKLMSSLKAQLAEINRLPSALLRRAFAGEGPV